MSSSTTPGNAVEVEGRFVLFEVGTKGPRQLLEQSDPFEMGAWKWRITVLRPHGVEKHTRIALGQCPPGSNPVTASVSLKLTCFPINQPAVVHNLPEVNVTRDDPYYTWTAMNVCVTKRFLVEIKFVDITMNVDYSEMEGVTKCGLPQSFWTPRSRPMEKVSLKQAKCGMASMLQQSILTDITLNAVGGSIRAYRAVLAARSPVFLSMFSHDLREKELSMVDIPDMSIAACRLFIGYLYGAATSEEELLAHRYELVVAGDKYGVTNLKKACENSLVDDVCTENVLRRLQVAHTYGLPALKTTCLKLLVDFGKMYQIPEDFEEFIKTGDQELVDEIKQIAASRGRKFPGKARRPSIEKSTSSQATGRAPGNRARRSRQDSVSASALTSSTSSRAPSPTACSSASKPESNSPALLRRSSRLKKLKVLND